MATAVSAVAAIGPALAGADQLVWDRGAGTLNWGDAANWSPNAVPGAANDVLLNVPGIFAGDVFDLGGTARAVNSLFLHQTSDAVSIARGTLNLRGSNSFNGYNLEDWGPNVTMAADVILGDPAAIGGAASFKWNLGNGTLAVTGSLSKASAAQTATLTTVGVGTLLFTGPSALHDDTVVSGGSVVFRPATAGVVAFGTGTISTSGPSSSFVLSGSTSQEYVLSNATKADSIDTRSGGSLITLESMPGANPTFALTGRHRGGVRLRTTGANTNPIVADVRGDLDMTGTSFDPVVSLDIPTGAAVRVSGAIIGGTDGIITGTGKLLLAGPSNSMAGTILSKSVFVEVAPGSSVGASGVSVRDNARLRLTDLATNLAPAAKITVSGAALVELPGTPAASALARFDPMSSGVFGLTGEPTGMDFNAGGFQDLQLGSASDLAVHDAWVPHANGYRIWGGWRAATLTLDAPNLLTGPNAFFVHGGSGTLGGHTVIAQPQDLGGDTWIEGGTLTLRAARALGTTDLWVHSGTVEVAAAGALDAAQVEWGQTGTVIVSHPDAFRTDPAAPTPMLKLPYGTLAFDSGARPGVTAFDVSITSIGNKPSVEARGAVDGARASVHDLAMWSSTVNFGVPVGATVRTGLRVTGATTFASGAVFNVTAPAAATAADAGGAFLALDGPVTASKPGVPLIKSGPGSLGLFNPANAFTGLTVNGGLIVFDSAAALGDPAATINLSGGGLRYAGAGAATIGQTVAVGAAGATLDAYGQGSLTVAGPLTGGGGTAGLAKVGPGTVVFGAANSPYTGPLDVRAGTLRISGSVPNSKGVTVAAGATFEAAATQSVAALTVNGGGAARVAPGGHNVLSVRALDLAVANPTTGAGGASFDVLDGGLIFDHDGGGAAAALAYVRDRVRSAFAGGTWTGSGITSSTAASDGRRGVGFAEARDVVSLVGGVGRFMGAAVDDTAIVVRATVLGDATLDGVVNFDDLLALAKHYNASGDAAVWSAGDFTYDATVNFDDLLVLAKNYNATLPAADLAVAGAPAAFPALMAAAFEAAVPEPSGGVLAMAAACTAMTSRRRRRAGRPG